MRKANKAVKIFKDYLYELESIADSKTGNTWKTKVHDTIVLYLGSESSFLDRLDDLHFTDKETHVMKNAIGFTHTYTFNTANKANFKNLINSIIHFIQSNGVKDDFIRTNFLSQFNTGQILGGILVCGNIVFWIGWFVGGTQKDREIMNFEKRIEKDSLNIETLKFELKNKTAEGNKLIEEIKVINNGAPIDNRLAK